MRDRESPNSEGAERLTYEEVERQSDRRASVKSAKEGELLAQQLGVTPEELDRHLRAEDAKGALQDCLRSRIHRCASARHSTISARRPHQRPCRGWLTNVRAAVRWWAKSLKV